MKKIEENWRKFSFFAQKWLFFGQNRPFSGLFGLFSSIFRSPSGTIRTSSGRIGTFTRAIGASHVGTHVERSSTRTDGRVERSSTRGYVSTLSEQYRRYCERRIHIGAHFKGGLRSKPPGIRVYPCVGHVVAHIGCCKMILVQFGWTYSWFQ